MENFRDGGQAPPGWPSVDTGSATSGGGSGFESGAQEREDDVKARLGSVIEAEIIPRLMLAHCVDPVTLGRGAILVEPQVDAFAELALSADAGLAWDYVQRLRAAGVSVERLYMDLLAPAARRLGELWSSDEADFVDVTIALSRMQQILHRMSSGGVPSLAMPDPRRRIVLAPAPGEQHTFGLSMVATFFRDAGWDVMVAAGTVQDVIRLVRRERIGLVGFSVSSDLKLTSLSAAIRRVRKASKNPRIGILVGGQVFVEKPETAVLIGADATAPDGPTGVLMAQSVLDLRARAC